jgi:hypothetical protein
VHFSCPRQMCRMHCIAHGRCMVKGHSFTMLLEKQRSKLEVPSQPVILSLPMQSFSSQPTSSATPLDDNHSFEISDSHIEPTLPVLNEPHATESAETNLDNAQEPQATLQQASILALAAPLRQPRITHQMSDLWMRQVNDRPVSQLRLKGTHDHQAVIDVSTMQRFTLVYWDAPNQPAMIRCIQDLPDWPKWRLSDDSALLNSLGQDLHEIDIYSQKYCVWMQVNLGYTHTLTPESHIFMRRRNVTCLDEQVQIDRFLNPPHPLHFHDNLPAERKAVRAALKHVCSPSKRGLDDFAPDDCSSRRPRLVLTIPDSPTTAAGGSPTPTSSSVGTPSPLVMSLTDALPVLSSSIWHAGMYAIDMMEGFVKIDDPALAHLGLSERFQHVFKHPFHKSTYYDQRKRWAMATEEQQKMALDRGHSSSGLWTLFANDVRLK